MKYIEGIDYWVRRIQFPNMASESVVASHGDGTFTIYINTLFSPERQEERLRHEVRHLTEEHFYRDDLTIQQIERQADGIETPPTDVRILPGPEPKISIFRSSSLPEDISFGFHVPDDSLKPILEMGQIAYCDDKHLKSGDIGLFLYHEKTVCRQYHRDVFGITYLFTIDRSKRIDDIVIPSCNEGELICIGHVRTPQSVPLPGLSGSSITKSWRSSLYF